VSASKKKKERQADEAVQAAAVEREQKLQQKAQAERRSMRMYAAVGIIVAVLAVLLVVWNSGFIQRSATAVTVNGVKYTTADAQFYYNSTYNSILNYYYGYMGILPFDYTVPVDEQMYDEENGITWHDYLMEESVNAMVSDTALVAMAEAEGYTMSQSARDSIDTFLADLERAWPAQGHASMDAYVRANFGTYMTYDRLVKLVEQQTLASDYSNAYLADLEFSDSEYKTYYDENADLLDTYTLTQYVFQASVATTDENGESLGLTEEEIADQLEKAKTEQKALADDLLARLKAGEDDQDLADEFEDQLYSSSLSSQRSGTSLSTYSFAEWAMDAARKDGDITLSENEGTNSHFYYVVRFEGRHLDESLPANVRHALIAAETDEGASVPTAAQYAAAKEEAEALLKEWESDGTEEAFAALAAEHSADTGSAANGGLITNITAGSGYVETFANWALDSARKEGDTGIVQNTGSTVKGWHLMYFVGHADPIWKQNAYNAMANEDYSAWLETVTEDYEATTGSGMKYVEG